MAGPVRIAILANGSQARREFQQTSGTLAKLGSQAKQMAGYGLLAAGAAVTKFGVDSVKAASDAQQSLGATESVFGKFAGTVIKRSNQAADAIGLSANEYRELSNVTGAMLASAGTPLRKVADLTDQLNRRAADMAATFGGTTKDAVQSISALLRGETDPIEKYGVSIKQSDISARLAAKGLDKLEGSARKQAEQQERLALLFDQTKKSAGQFARESDTLAGAQQRLGAKAEDLKAKFGTLLLPVLTDVTNWAGDELVPALEDLQKWLADNKDEFAELGGTVKDTLLPPLKTAVDVIGDAIGFFSGLPGPVKAIGVEAAVAALIVPRLTTAVAGSSAAITFNIARLKQLQAEMTYTATRSQALGGALTRMAGMAKAAAGVGGIVALTQASTTANKKLQALGNVGGGALLGFSVGGPIGAAIGGTAGALLSMKQSADRAKDSLIVAKPPAVDFADSLNQITGAATKASREVARLALQEQGAFATGAELGIQGRDLIDASLGHADALKRVNAVLHEQSSVSDVTVDAYGNFSAVITGEASPAAQKLIGILGNVSDSLTRDGVKVRKHALLVENLSTVFKGVPENVLTEFRTGNIPKSRKDVRQLLKVYDLSPKQVSTIVRATNIGKTERDVKRITRALMDAGNTKADLKGWVAGIDTATKKGARYSERDSRLIVKKLEAIKEARPDLAPYIESVKTSVTKATGEANKSTKVGAQLKQGLLNGMAGTSSALSAIMSGAVRDAIRAAKREADSHSPSRKTMRLGRDLGLGLQIGLARTAGGQRKAGKDAVSKILRGMEGAAGAKSAADKINALIRKKIDLKNDKAERAREKKIIKHLKDRYAGLVKIGKAQDRLSKKLEKAKQQLSEVRGWVNQVKQSFVDTGNVVNLGQLEDGTVSGTLLLDQLRDKVANAKRFAQIIRDLTDSEGAKLNKTTLDQLLQAGPEAGLATAEALVAGGDAALEEINVLTKELATQGQSLGAQMSGQFFDIGLQAAEGIVKGLKSRQGKLDRQMERLADALAKAVRKKLGIHSPSRVFEGIGGNVIEGLSIGLDDTHVRRSGRALAGSLVKGFGTPALDAYLAGGSRRSPQVVTIRLTADQTTALQRGAAYTADVQVAGTAGSRSLAVRRS